MSHFSYPIEYYSITVPMGIGVVYLPASQEVYADNKGTLTSKDDLMYIFLSRAVNDMGLLKYGYVLRSSTYDSQGYLKKSFASNDSDKAPFVDVVFKEYLPVYMEYKNSDGSARGKTFFSNYTDCSAVRFPLRTTEIIYPDAKDSIVVRTVYSNLNADCNDELLDFKIPSEAKVIKK